MFFRESHLSGAEVVLCGLPSGWSFWNTASYREIRAVSGRGLLALLFGIAKTCFPSVRECFPCLMLCVRRCPPEAPLRLSHHSRRNRSFMFSRSVVTFLSCKCSPLTYICLDITLLLNAPSSCPVGDEFPWPLHVFSGSCSIFENCWCILMCLTGSHSVFEVFIFTLSRLFISNLPVSEQKGTCWSLFTS